METRCKREDMHRLSPMPILWRGRFRGQPHTAGGDRGLAGSPILAPHPGCFLSALLSPGLFLTLNCWKQKQPWLFSPRYEQRGKAEQSRLRALLQHHFGGT